MMPFTGCQFAGSSAAGVAEGAGEAPAHRVLVFAQLKSLLDLVETEARRILTSCTSSSQAHISTETDALMT